MILLLPNNHNRALVSDPQKRESAAMSDLNNVECFLNTIASGRVCIGSVISLNDPAVSELFAEAGYDFTWIDLEHSPLSLEAALGHVMAVRGTRTAPFVRVAWNDPVLLKPVLEMVPAGIIVPMVRTAKEAATAVSACKYPPVGIRGFGPRRGIRYGGIATVDYLPSDHAKTLVMLQIEHIDAVQNLNEILSVPGVDGICIGPNDLAGSMGKLGKTDDPEVRAVILQVLRTARQFNRLTGIATGFDPETFKFWLASGVQWVSLGCDWHSLAAYSRSTLSAAREAEQNQVRVRDRR